MLQRIDAAIYRVERQVVAWAMVVMGLVVALDVVHRVATRQNGFLERAVRRILPDSLGGSAATVASVLIGLVGLAAFYAVFRRRGVASKPRALLYAAIAVGVFWGLVELYVRAVPSGLVWSQTLGLALMIWAGFVGSSLATRERRHLSLEIGPRLFPARARKYVVALGHLVTAGFCVFLLVLAIWSVTQHYGDWTDSGHEGGTFTAAALRGQETSADEVATFKKLGGIEDGPTP
jgi:TRAP-type C4-dicarboxylate transport system permease small subunit